MARLAMDVPVVQDVVDRADESGFWCGSRSLKAEKKSALVLQPVFDSADEVGSGAAAGL